MRLCTFHQRRVLGNISLGRTATSTNDIHQTLFDVFIDLTSHIFWSLVVFTQAVRKTGIGICTNIIRCSGSQLLEVRFQLLGSERTIQANREYGCMLDRSQESIQCLTRQGASTCIGHRNGKHQRDFPTHLFHGFHSCIDSSLGIERIEDGFYQDGIHASFNQSFHLFLISQSQLIEGDGTKCRIVHIRTHGASLVGRPYRTCHKTRLIGIHASIFIGQLTSQLGSSQVDFATIVFHMIVGHRNTLGIKRIGFDDISTSLQILAMNILNDMRSS